MRLARTVYRSALAVATAAFALTAGATAATARDKPIALGEVTTQVARDGVDLGAVLRQSAETELRAMDVSPRERSIVSLSLTKMETQATAHGLTTTCVVSATLRTARGGTLVAILEGRARAENATSHRRALEENVVRGAVHGALERLPDALR